MLVLAETPNRLIPHDSHSTFLHFFQTLPPEIALEYVRRSPRSGAAEAVAAGAEALYRFGQGASYHEFELWMERDGKLPAIRTDGWSHWPMCDEPLRRDELWLNDYLDAHGPIAPPAFARYWLDAVFDGAAPPGETPKAPRLSPPQQLHNAAILSDRRFHLPDMLVVNAGGRATFPLPNGCSPTLLLDLDRSAGEVVMENARGEPLVALNIAALRAARFPRRHQCCAIDLTGIAPVDEVTLRPTGNSTAVSSGLLVR
jgi:hypothetical protein